MICNPEAVVMGFPAVWAVALVGIKAGIARNASATAANNEIVAPPKRRMFFISSDGSEACLAHPSGHANRLPGLPAHQETGLRERCAVTFAGTRINNATAPIAA